MRFSEFEALAREIYDEIPEVYKEGIDGLTVSRDAPEHPDHPGIYTLGECLTEEHVSDYGSAETTRSIIALYWGSFRALAERGEDFDWEEETWETLTHELRHHLESLAGDDALEGVDYAADQSFKRFDGEPFDPWYYQYGDEPEDGVFKVESLWYVERPFDADELAAAEHVDFTWRGRGYRVPAPEEEADLHFIYLPGLDADGGSVELVLVRRRSVWENLKRLFTAARPAVAEWEADPEPLDADPSDAGPVGDGPTGDGPTGGEPSRPESDTQGGEQGGGGRNST